MLKYILTGIVLLLIGYAFGCFSTGYLVGKRNGMDIRSTGSGNIGTTNALRSMGAKAGAITFLGDLLKAFVPMLLVKYVYCAHMGYDPNQSVAYMYTLFTGLGVVLGHNFPVTLRFKGGKGIAVSAAVIVVSTMDPLFIGVGLALFIAVVAITRYVSLGSLIVVWYIPIFSVIHFRGDIFFPVILVLSLMFTVLAYIKHSANIKRLLNGTENKLGAKKGIDGGKHNEKN